MEPQQQKILILLAVVVVVIVAAVLLMTSGGGVETILCTIDDSEMGSGTIKMAESRMAMDVSMNQMGMALSMNMRINPSGTYMKMDMLGDAWYLLDSSEIPGMNDLAMGMGNLDKEGFEEAKKKLAGGESPPGMTCSVGKAALSDFEVPAGAKIEEGLPSSF